MMSFYRPVDSKRCSFKLVRVIDGKSRACSMSCGKTRCAGSRTHDPQSAERSDTALARMYNSLVDDGLTEIWETEQ
jgi:hypothetical protein